MDNTMVSALVLFLGLTNVEMLAILDSGIFNHWRFSMEWAETTHLKIKTYAMFGNILENVPQLIIQGLYLNLHGITGVTIASLIVSAFSLVYAILRRALLFVVLIRVRRGKSGQDDLSTALLPTTSSSLKDNVDEFVEDCGHVAQVRQLQGENADLRKRNHELHKRNQELIAENERLRSLAGVTGSI